MCYPACALLPALLVSWRASSRALPLASSFLLAVGIALLIAGLILFVIFGALSEIIRLLKAANGLPYTGTISGSGTGTIYVCSDCGSLNYPDIAKCRKCGAEFEKQGSEGQTF